MTTAAPACPVCGLRGCAARVQGAEAVDPLVVAQLRIALDIAALPEVPSAGAVRRPRVRRELVASPARLTPAIPSVSVPVGVPTAPRAAPIPGP